MQVKLLLVTFYVNGGLHAVSVAENCLNGCQIFGRFGFKNEIRTNVWFSAHRCCFPAQNLTEVRQSTAELWPKKTDFQYGSCLPS